MTIAKRFCVLGLILMPMVGLGTFMGIGWGCGLDNMFASFLLIQALIISAFVVMLVGYNMKNVEHSKNVCMAGVLLFALAIASTAWGFNYKVNGVWRPYADLQTAKVEAVLLSSDGQPLEAEDAAQVLELMQQVKLRNPVMDGDWAPYPEAAKGERSYFLVRLTDDRAYSLGLRNEYYFHNGNCFEADNPEVGAALQRLYAELLPKYGPADDGAHLAAE